MHVIPEMMAEISCCFTAACCITAGLKDSINADAETFLLLKMMKLLITEKT